MRLEFADPKDEFGLGHRISLKDASIGAGGLSISSGCQNEFPASRASDSDGTVFGQRQKGAGKRFAAAASGLGS